MELLFVFFLEVFVVHLVTSVAFDHISSAVCEVGANFGGWYSFFTVFAGFCLLHSRKILPERYIYCRIAAFYNDKQLKYSIYWCRKNKKL